MTLLQQTIQAYLEYNHPEWEVASYWSDVAVTVKSKSSKFKYRSAVMLAKPYDTLLQRLDNILEEVELDIKQNADIENGRND